MTVRSTRSQTDNASSQACKPGPSRTPTFSAFAKDNLNIGIVTFSASDIHTNQMVDTMASEAKSKGWTVKSLNANGDPSQAIARSNSLSRRKPMRSL